MSSIVSGFRRVRTIWQGDGKGAYAKVTLMKFSSSDSLANNHIFVSARGWLSYSKTLSFLKTYVSLELMTA